MVSGTQVAITELQVHMPDLLDEIAPSRKVVRT